MKRRTFVAGLGSAAAWPLAVRAQQQDGRVRRIGLLDGSRELEGAVGLGIMRKRLAELGWIEGRNARIDHLLFAGTSNRIGPLAQQLVGLQPDIIVANTTPATVALQRETRTIPIVFTGVIDPVASGLVARLDRPSGNITGFARFEATLGAKWLELLSEIEPGLKRAAIMFNPDTFPRLATFMPSLEKAAKSLTVEPIIARVHSDVEIETAIMGLGREPGGGLVVMPDTFVNAHRELIISVAARNKVSAVYPGSYLVRDGGLISYGGEGNQLGRAATYVDRILRGAKPGDLPVQFPVKYEMAVNLKTAKALGLTVPQSILLRADEVIE